MKNDSDIKCDVVCIIELLTISFKLRRQVSVSPIYPFIILSREMVSLKRIWHAYILIESQWVVIQLFSSSYFSSTSASARILKEHVLTNRVETND